MTSRRSFLGMLAALAVSGVVAPTVTGCTAEPGNVDTSDMNLITTDISEPQRTLIPADSNDAPGQTIINLVYSGLMYLDETGGAHYDLAESITQVDDTTYDVVIRDDAVFSDGSTVEAEDFVDTWNTAVRQSLLSAHHFEPIRGFHEGRKSMRGLKVTGPKTFRIELSRPTAGFLERLGYSVFFPMRSEDQDRLSDRGTDPIGSGPYVLASWEREKAVTLVPNPRYKGPRTPQNEGIKFVVYSSEEQAYQDLVDGKLDVLTRIPAEKLGSFEKELGSRALTKPGGSIMEITIPANDANFRGEAGRLRRRALSMAIDREGMARDIFHGMVLPTTGFVAPLDGSIPPTPEGADVLTYQPEKARELWEQAEKLEPFDGIFSISYNTDGGHKTWIDAVAKQLSDTLGVPAEGHEFATLKDLRQEVIARHLTGAFRTIWQAEFPEESTFLVPLYASYSSENESGFNSSEYDELLKKAGQAKSREEAQKHYTEAQGLLLEKMPAIPLWTTKTFCAFGEDIVPAGYTWKPTPNYYLIHRA